jgi:hypothetical protein
MKVYVVTTGFYDDIEAIFYNRESAEKIASYMDEASISEWELNDISQTESLPWYYIEMEKDGDVLCIAKKDNYGCNKCESPLHVEDDILLGDVLAKDEREAVQVANDKRLNLIENNEWK